MTDSIRIKNLIVGNNKLQGKEGFDFFTQNQVSTIRVAAPVGQLGTDAVPGKVAEIPAAKGGVRSCIASWLLCCFGFFSGWLSGIDNPEHVLDGLPHGRYSNRFAVTIKPVFFSYLLVT